MIGYDFYTTESSRSLSVKLRESSRSLSLLYFVWKKCKTWKYSILYTLSKIIHKFKPKQDCNNLFPIDLSSIGTPFDVKSIGVE